MSELSLYAADMAALKAVEETITGIMRVELYSKDTIPKGALPAILHEMPTWATQRETAGDARARFRLTYSVPTTIIVCAYTGRDLADMMADAATLADRYIGTIIDNSSLAGMDVQAPAGRIVPVQWNESIAYLCVVVDLTIMHIIKAE